MDINKLITYIDTALSEANDFVIKYYKGNEDSMINTKKVLFLLKEELLQSQSAKKINPRVLRAMHDIGAIAVKAYENTPLDDAIGNIVSMLYHDLPGYKKLEPLRMDFGKGDPI